MNELNREMAVEILVGKVREYARGRQKDIARGAETPRLAALLIQKYGVGVVEAVAVIFDSFRAADPIQKAVDEEVERIDPDWCDHGQARWAGRPADVVAHGTELE